jgi:hypothetical protein
MRKKTMLIRNCKKRKARFQVTWNLLKCNNTDHRILLWLKTVAGRVEVTNKIRWKTTMTWIIAMILASMLL